MFKSSLKVKLDEKSKTNRVEIEGGQARYSHEILRKLKAA